MKVRQAAIAIISLLEKIPKPSDIQIADALLIAKKLEKKKPTARQIARAKADYVALLKRSAAYHKESSKRTNRVMNNLDNAGLIVTWPSSTRSQRPGRPRFVKVKIAQNR